MLDIAKTHPKVLVKVIPSPRKITAKIKIDTIDNILDIGYALLISTLVRTIAYIMKPIAYSVAEIHRYGSLITALNKGNIPCSKPFSIFCIPFFNKKWADILNITPTNNNNL